MELNTLIKAETARMMVASPVKNVTTVKEVQDQPIVASAVSGVEKAIPVATETRRNSLDEELAVADALREITSFLGNELNFEIDKDTGKILVKILDPESHEVIRQIPTEVVVNMSKRLSELKGILLDIKE